MSLKELLAARGIICAHIVDDAFDKVPTYALKPEEAQHLLEVADDANLKVICDILNLPEADEDSVRSRLQGVEDIHLLFAHRNRITGEAAKALFDPFDKDKEGKLSQLKPLIELLEANDVKCHLFGGDYDPKNTCEPQLFFIDLKLKEGTGNILQHEEAVRVYNALKTVHTECKPFVFLMSSLTLALGEKRELFRRDADLFQSEFEDIDKAAFANGDELSRVLASYTKSMPQLATLRYSMEQVELAVREATKSVMRELRALDLADYFVLYHNTTSVEKVKLGSYVVEMLLEFLAHEVEGHEQVWNLAKVLDGLNVQELPRARFGLTPAAARLYSANMLHSRSMLIAEESMEDGPSQGYFFTGDIFFEAQPHVTNPSLPTKALVIITPACDLVRPEKLKERNILLCEGSVREMEPGITLIAKDELPLVVMQHPDAPERHIIIEWHRKKLHVWDETERAKFSNPEQCSFARTGRLRPVFALQLQQAITSDLSRVGTQKPPSTLIPHRLKCFVSDGKNWHEVYATQMEDAAALSNLKVGEKQFTMYVLSDPTVHKALVKLAAWIAENPQVENKASLEKVLGDDARETLRSFRQRVPEKAQPGKERDVTAYPFDGKWTGNEAKLVALVRDFGCSSPYSQIANGHKVTEKQVSKVVFRLERPVVSDDCKEETETETDVVAPLMV